MSKCVNVGKVTAYADAVAGGYTGTREQWEEAIANVGNEAVEALQAKNAAEAAASNSEAFANGTRDGEPVESDDPAYHKNAAYWAGEAAESARTLTLDTTLTQSGQAAEAKAVGDQLTDLKSAISIIGLEKIKLNITDKYFQTGNTTINPASPSSSSNFDCAAIECIAGDKFTVHAGGLSDNSLPWVFIDASNNVLLKSSTIVFDGVITAPTNTSKLIINNRKAAYPDYVSYYGVPVTNTVADMEQDLSDVEVSGAYLIRGIAFETGSINSSGEETEGSGYSRTVDYLSTAYINYIATTDTSLMIYYYNYVNDNYVFQESQSVSSGATKLLKTEYEYFRIRIGVTLENHPEEKCLFYKYTANKNGIIANGNEINAIKSRELGKYKSPVYMSSAFVPIWSINKVGSDYIATLSLEHDINVIFEGFSYPSTEFIPTNDIYTAASASEYTTVSDNNISGGNYAIIYNIATKVISIVQASTYKYNSADEIVLFAAYGNSFISGALIDYAVARDYQKTLDRIGTLESHEENLYTAKAIVKSGHECSWWREYSTDTNVDGTIHLYIADDVVFTGYPSTNTIALSDILTAASSAGLTVTNGVICYKSFTIYYDLQNLTVKISKSTTFKPKLYERILFRGHYSSYFVGDLVDYAIAHDWMPLLNKIDTAVNPNYEMPIYWSEYMATKIADVQGKDLIVGNHGDSFIFCTDQHYDTNDGNSPSLINYIKLHSSVSTLVMGGDLINGRTSGKQDAINDLINARNRYITFSPKYLRGNHDNNTEITDPTPEKKISDSELYAIIMKPVENEVVANGNLYYYFDNNAQKIRYICMDTGEPGSTAYTQPDAQTGDDTDPQIIWMKARITELSSGWTAVILTHKFFKTQDDVLVPDGNGTAIMHGLDAIYDTANATIACVIAGHNHRDYSETTTKGYPIIATTCDNRGGELGGGTRTRYTTTEQAFDVFHIDTYNRDIYATRIGYGSDRTFSY